MFGLTGKEVYEYGIYVFILWIATFLVRKTWSLLEGKITNIDNNVTENKRLNKDIAVIQAQTLDKIDKHDKSNAEAWSKILIGFDRICDFLNGKNPAIAKIKAEMQAEMQAEMKELEKKIK